MKKKLSLWLLLLIVFVVTLLLSVSVSYAFILKNAAQRVRQNEEVLLFATGQQVAETPFVTTQLELGQTSDELQAYTTNLARIYQLDFVVVMDMNAIRLTHPDQTKIGQHFAGGDETEALHGKRHTSVSQGTLGKSLRVFVPIFNQAENQIGVVSLGVKLNSLSTMIRQSQNDYQISLFISLILSLIVAFSLSFYLKRILLNLEPQEIASLLEERNAMLNETKDAVVVIDLNHTVLLANVQAQTLYHYTTEQTDLVGKKVQELLYHFQQIDLDKKVEQLYQQHEQDYLFSAAPIVIRGQKTGYVIFLRNATESIFVTDQLANTTAYATALQSQSHEFMNKLHVIYGLADLKAYDELSHYLEELLTPEQEFAHTLAMLVKDPLIAAFLIGERQKFAEVKTNLIIEIFPEIPQNINKEKTLALITVYRYIHHALLRKEVPKELNLLIEWSHNRLRATYTFKSENLTPENWLEIQKNLASYYFKQILIDNNGTIDFLPQGICLTIEYIKKESN